MEFTDERTDDGVTRRSFQLTVDGETVPAVIWAPAGAAAASAMFSIRRCNAIPLVGASSDYPRLLDYTALAGGGFSMALAVSTSALFVAVMLLAALGGCLVSAALVVRHVVTDLEYLPNHLLHRKPVRIR